MVEVEGMNSGKRYMFFEGGEPMDWENYWNWGESLSEKEEEETEEEILTFSQLYGCFVLDTFVEIKDSKDEEIYNGEIANMSEIVFNAIKGLDVLQIEPHPDFEGLLITVMK